MTGRAPIGRFLALTMALFALACGPGGLKGLGSGTATKEISATALATETILAQPLEAVPSGAVATGAVATGAVAGVADADPQPLQPQPLQPLTDAVAAQTVPAPEVTEPPPPKPPSSPEEAACLKKGDLWIHAGKSIAYTCVRMTRDSGKQCRKGSDCQGSCLARSMTCAPYDPLFGCNEVLQDDGSRVTLCID